MEEYLTLLAKRVGFWHFRALDATLCLPPRTFVWHHRSESASKVIGTQLSPSLRPAYAIAQPAHLVVLDIVKLHH